MSSWLKKSTTNNQRLIILVSETDIIDLNYHVDSILPESDIIIICHKINDEYVTVETLTLDNKFLKFYKLHCNNSTYLINKPEQMVSIRNNHKIGKSNKQMKIPKRIIQTWETKDIDDIPLGFSKKALQKLNPEYEYCLFNANERREFLVKHFDTRTVNAYDKLKPKAYKCDLWRYCCLYILGGIYVDIKTSPVKPFYSILDKDYELLLVTEQTGNGLFNGLMGFPPKHRFSYLLINECLSRIENNYYGDTPLDPTGPNLCRYVYNVYKNKNPNDILRDECDEYKYLELTYDNKLIDYKTRNIYFYKQFSTYYILYNNTDDPNRFTNAWKNRTIYEDIITDNHNKQLLDNQTIEGELINISNSEQKQNNLDNKQLLDNRTIESELINISNSEQKQNNLDNKQLLDNRTIESELINISNSEQKQKNQQNNLDNKNNLEYINKQFSNGLLKKDIAVKERNNQDDPNRFTNALKNRTIYEDIITNNHNKQLLDNQTIESELINISNSEQKQKNQQNNLDNKQLLDNQTIESELINISNSEQKQNNLDNKQLLDNRTIESAPSDDDKSDAGSSTASKKIVVKKTAAEKEAEAAVKKAEKAAAKKEAKAFETAAKKEAKALEAAAKKAEKEAEKEAKKAGRRKK